MKEARQKIIHHLAQIYPDADLDTLAQKSLNAFGVGTDNAKPRFNDLWSQRDTLMITYGDTFLKEGEKPLTTLKNFLDTRLKDVLTGVHILPFFPYTSDDGFAVQDYDLVRPDLGDWSDITAIAKDFRFMGDLVVNHASSQHKWFKQFQENAAPGNGFIKTAELDDDLKHVIRPRPFELLRETETKDGTKYVWCTFSHDQVDLDFSNPDLLIEMLAIMGRYIDYGVRIFRLDAVAFLWKEAGTSSIHLPQTHEIIKLMRTLADMRNETIILITETNVPNHENIQYFGNANEAHIVYNFSLPPLLLHALLTGRSEHLRHWAANMPPLQNGCTYLNFTASHDGIGLRPTEGLLSQNDIDLMLNTIENFGGRVTTRTVSEGVEKPYEMNITYFDALKGTIQGADELQVERFIASQTIMMGLQGIPAFYVHSLLGTTNDYHKLEKTQHNRSINRSQLDYDDICEKLDDNTSIHARVFNETRRRLAIRINQPAFHPDATQYLMQPQSGFFGFIRQHKGEGQFIHCVTNLQDREQTLSLLDLNLDETQNWIDLISGQAIDDLMADMTFAPYQTVWLTQA
ncbi:alpha-amylase family glycosyl hydrolase [Terasakiella sp. A23]|uniref:alpha-amylase family glycosyl hydrolase n=1 Tax=Terasakiella sp. FCG-A23 TaxID=3080561 RepID=UPI00295445BA|nr:alpha-amylase family glycosyl hydrolase [Terasakiella sp. A23]MDV7338630.1 alpha-amylase family glycosyl hydrolase [Terasakiella sp. A23]